MRKINVIEDCKIFLRESEFETKSHHKTLNLIFGYGKNNQFEMSLTPTKAAMVIRHMEIIKKFLLGQKDLDQFEVALDKYNKDREENPVGGEKAIAEEEPAKAKEDKLLPILPGLLGLPKEPEPPAEQEVQILFGDEVWDGGKSNEK